MPQASTSNTILHFARCWGPLRDESRPVDPGRAGAGAHTHAHHAREALRTRGPNRAPTSESDCRGPCASRKRSPGATGPRACRGDAPASSPGARSPLSGGSAPRAGGARHTREHQPGALRAPSRPIFRRCARGRAPPAPARPSSRSHLRDGAPRRRCHRPQPQLPGRCCGSCGAAEKRASAEQRAPNT